MEHLQMTFDELLTFLDQRREERESVKITARLAASSPAPEHGYYCFGAADWDIGPGDFQPDAAGMIRRYPVIRYYLERRILSPGAVIDLYGDGKRHYTITAGELYAAM